MFPLFVLKVWSCVRQLPWNVTREVGKHHERVHPLGIQSLGEAVGGGIPVLRLTLLREASAKTLGKVATNLIENTAGTGVRVVCIDALGTFIEGISANVTIIVPEGIESVFRSAFDAISGSDTDLIVIHGVQHVGICY